MRLRWLLLLLALTASADATTSRDSNYNLAISSGGSTPVLTALGPATCYNSATFISSFTSTQFPSVPIGVGRVIAVIGTVGTAAAVTSPTINGNAANVDVSTPGVSIVSATNASGTTGPMTFTISGGANAVCISTYLATGLSSTTPTSTGVTVAAYPGPSGTSVPLGSALTVSAGGFGIVAVAGSGLATTPLPLTWTVGTVDTANDNFATDTPGAGAYIETAHITTSGTPAYNVNSVNAYSDQQMVGASYR